jgi:hypothetical protein
MIEINWQPVARMTSTVVGVGQIRNCTCVEDVEGLIEDRIYQELRARVAPQFDSTELRAAAERLFAMREAIACPAT